MDSVAIVLDTLASSLEVPWGLAFAPDGRIFVTERAGRIRVIEHDSLRRPPWATLDVAADGEAGLMGIAISPDFARDHHIFVVATVRTPAGLVNRVVRFTDVAGIGTSPTVIVDSIPSNELHAGDAIAFGPDGKLYVATGDARSPMRAGDMRSLAGKILRYMPDGSVPADNPTPGSPVYARGLRNAQGLAWRDDGVMVATDHGPSGFPNELYRTGHDELNVVRAGGNYGWPRAAGRTRFSRSIAPIAEWTPSIAPAGVAFYTGTEIPEWKGNVFVGALIGEQLKRLVLDGTGDAVRVVAEQRVLRGIGRIRAVVMGPDGFLYVTTSDRDGRGNWRKGDDHVFRLRRR
jgi:glucose/arabinose dehydrogenase